MNKRTGIAGLCLAVSLLLGAPAFAAEKLEPDLARATERVGVVSDRATRLLRAIAPGRAFPLRGEAAIQRYMDCVTFEMLGEHEEAASGLFTLVTTGVLVDAGLHQDAEWSLAESLFNGGNVETAEVRLEGMLADAGHPFRPEAVRTLLEILARQRRTEEFYQLYQQEIASGKVRATDAIIYSVGRSFWIQGTFSRKDAAAQFARLQPESRFYSRAQYFLGTIHTADGDLASAIPVFENVTKLPIAGTEDRKLHDLAILALGRIYYERGDFLQATTWYNQISGDSPLLDRALYELSWTYIKQSKNADALKAIDIYLLSFPNGDGAAELKVVQGQLNMMEQTWDQALVAFDQVVTEYTPVKEQLGALARSTEDHDTYFARVVAIGEGTATDIPEYARTLILADKELGQAIHLFTELEDQRRDIEYSEALIAELEVALSGAEAMDLAATQAEIEAVQAECQAQRQNLFALEEEWLGSIGASNQAIQDLRRRRTAMPAVGDPAAIRSIRADYAVLRKGRTSVVPTRLDGLHGTLDRAESELADSKLRLTSPDVEDIGRLRAVFDQEVLNVAGERADRQVTLGRAQTVSVALTREGFGRLEDLFGRSVLAADTGIVDVYWGEKIQTVDSKEELQLQKVDVLADIDRRFDLIRQKMGQE